MAKRASRNSPKGAKNWGMAILLPGIAVVALLLLWYTSSRPTGSSQPVQFPHIHGLGFSADGRQLFVPAHDGFRIFENGHWFVPDIPAHDYMGYSPTDNGFYSSGHPGIRTNFVNPLGLLKSTDGGQTLITLDVEGESDFHLMSVGYKNHAIYVFNPEPNSKLPTGFHYSLDDGETWEPMAAQGIVGNPIQIAVHPIEAQTVALAAEGGLFLSTDYGNTFAQISQAAPVTSVAFDPRGQRLLFGYQPLNSYDLESEQISTLNTPTITGEDAINYIAVNPLSEQIAIATFFLDIYFSSDNGKTWDQIAQQGVGRT